MLMVSVELERVFFSTHLYIGAEVIAKVSLELHGQALLHNFLMLGKLYIHVFLYQLIYYPIPRQI